MNKSQIAVLISLSIVLTGFIDTKFDLLQDAGFSLLAINRIKLAGLVLSAILPSISDLYFKETE